MPSLSNIREPALRELTKNPQLGMEEPVFVHFMFSWDEDVNLTERELLFKAFDALERKDKLIMRLSQGCSLPDIGIIDTATTPVLSVEGQSNYFDSLSAEDNVRDVLKTWIKEIDSGKRSLFRKEDLFVVRGHPMLNHEVRFGAYSREQRRSPLRHDYHRSSFR